jgi:hypothetical protein
MGKPIQSPDAEWVVYPERLPEIPAKKSVDEAIRGFRFLRVSSTPLLQLPKQ